MSPQDVKAVCIAIWLAICLWLWFAGNPAAQQINPDCNPHCKVLR